MTPHILLIAFAAGAAFIQRTTGFGFGIFIMTMLPYLMPSLGEATALSGLLAAVTSLAIVIQYRQLILWRKLLPILITFLVVSWGAVHCLSYIPAQALRISLGIVLILAALYFWFFSDRVRVGHGTATAVSLGTLSGFMGGFFGMQGPPAVLYFLEVSDRKQVFAAMAQCYFLVGNLMMTGYRAQAGFLTHEVWVSWCWALPGVLIGTLLGAWVFRFISMPLLRKIVYVYIFISGVLALFS